jgi:hypothetical protein
MGSAKENSGEVIVTMFAGIEEQCNLMVMMYVGDMSV